MTVTSNPVANLVGYAPALPTPFHPDGALDIAGFERLCALQVSKGATALVVCGTTGEAPTLDEHEYRELVHVAARVAHGNIPVIAGAGSNATRLAIALARAAEAVGADGILSVVPYYNKPTQAGLIAHFTALTDGTGLPIILYDVPSRTGASLADTTIALLAERSRIVGLKDATGDVERVARLATLVGPAFRLLSGDDATAPAFLAQGGHGCISVTSNVAPGLCRLMFLAQCRGDGVKAEEYARCLAELTSALFLETNPGPLKSMLSLLGLMSDTLRLPLVAPNDVVQAKVAAALAAISADHAAQLILGEGSNATTRSNRVSRF